jgi:Protein of unknown function (DUF2637)
VSTLSPPTSRQAVAGEDLTRRAVTAITAIVAMALAFSVVNVARLCLDLGVTAWIAWLIGPSVDLSIIGLLTGIRFLSLHEYTEPQLAKLNGFLRFCGVLTLALNTAGAFWRLQFGTAAVDAIGPVLLIGWSDRPVAAARDQRGPRPGHARTDDGRRAEGQTGRGREARGHPSPAAWPAPGNSTPSTARRPAGPSPGDNLRERLQIGRERASALVAAVRAEAAAGAQLVSGQLAA